MASDQRKNIHKYIDLPPMTVSTGSMSVNDTGSWRNAEPRYVDHTPPCNLKCPAGNDIVEFLRLTTEGKYRAAWELILQTSPFPGVCGRVCPHPCESDCNRQFLGGSVKIHLIERFLADNNFAGDTIIPKIIYPQQPVAVIGSGPAGLSCAWHLNRMGYPVTVFEKQVYPGGMMRLGIPNFRLPKNVLSREVSMIERAGTHLKTGIQIGRDIQFADLRKEFSAVFIAVGFHHSYTLGIDGEDHPHVNSGVKFLRDVALGKKVELKKKVMVIGGGNTAVDTARTALRMGSDVQVIYRRTRTEMPAIPVEIDELLDEGIPLKFLTAPVKIYTDGDSIKKLECIRMKLGDPDTSGRRRPVPIEGSNFTIDAEQIFTAIGETADLSFLSHDFKLDKWGIPTGDFGNTNIEGVFAGGDAATGEGTVCHAIGSGRKTALAIAQYLQGEDFTAILNVSPSLQGVDPHIVTLDDLNLDYFETAPAIEGQKISPEKRIISFNEIHSGLTEQQALYESQRCISCGSCPECDNCLIFCPDGAVKYPEEPELKYLIDMKHCKGCGLCVEECPRYCIELHPVM